MENGKGPAAKKLYETLLNLVSTEAGKYRKRDYGKDMNERIEKERARIQEELHRRGFQGEYPDLERKAWKFWRWKNIPCTLGFMEWEKFDFRIRLMISKDSRGKKEIWEVNGGFFKGKGREGQIENVD